MQKMQYDDIANTKEAAMTTNIGTVDRIIRLIAGAALIAFALGYIYPGTGWNWAGWIGVVPILTALLGNCPAYTLLGVSTCPMRKA
jgi:4-hydroxybenzoate polyprenyltransferase